MTYLRSLPASFGELLIGRGDLPSTHERAVAPHDTQSAQRVLSHCTRDQIAMSVLRDMLQSESTGPRSRRMSDVEVVDRIAVLVAGGWLQLARRIPPPIRRDRMGGGGVSEPLRVIAAPSPTPRSQAEIEESTFGTGVDAAAVAAGLAAAAAAGIPLVQECARSSKAA